MAKLSKKVKELEAKVELLEKAAVEQGRLVANQGAKIKSLEEQANDLPEAVTRSISDLYKNQEILEWKCSMLLHVVDPGNHPNPGQAPGLKENRDESEAAQASTSTGS
jgi:hypothetical protein